MNGEKGGRSRRVDRVGGGGETGRGEKGVPISSREVREGGRESLSAYLGPVNAPLF